MVHITDICYEQNDINPLNSELNPICHLLALLGGATIVVVSRLRVKVGVTIGSDSVDRNRAC